MWGCDKGVVFLGEAVGGEGGWASRVQLLTFAKICTTATPSLVAGCTPWTSIDLLQTFGRALSLFSFKKMSLSSLVDTIKVQSWNMKIFWTERSEKGHTEPCNHWNREWTEKIFSKWTKWTLCKIQLLLWEKNEMNFSSLLLREYIFQLYNELVVGISSKFEQRAKKEKKSGCGELMLFVFLSTSRRLTFIPTHVFLLQGLEVVVDQGEEEESEEVKMDHAWIFLTSSAHLDLSLLREGFQGKNNGSEKCQHFIDYWKLGLRWVIPVELLWVFCHPSWQAVCYRTSEKPALVLHCINKDISWVHWSFHKISGSIW